MTGKSEYTKYKEDLEHYLREEDVLIVKIESNLETLKRLIRYPEPYWIDVWEKLIVCLGIPRSVRHITRGKLCELRQRIADLSNFLSKL